MTEGIPDKQLKHKELIMSKKKTRRINALNWLEHSQFNQRKISHYSYSRTHLEHSIFARKETHFARYRFVLSCQNNMGEMFDPYANGKNATYFRQIPAFVTHL